MSTIFVSLLCVASLGLGIFGAHEGGRFLGARYLRTHPSGLPEGSSAAQGKVFTTFGLVMAFALAGAAQRFETRRLLITEEANAIDTSYRRLDLLPTDAQPALRELFRSYAEVRADLYADDGRHYAERERETAEIQDEIWTLAVAGAGHASLAPAANTLLLGALNNMFDITTTRHATRMSHPPAVIFVMLGLLGMLAAVLVGFSSAESAHRSWLHSIVFCAVIAIMGYVVIDLEFPRLGLIRVDAADTTLVELRAEM